MVRPYPPPSNLVSLSPSVHQIPQIGHRSGSTNQTGLVLHRDLIIQRQVDRRNAPLFGDFPSRPFARLVYLQKMK
ncbi:hypothetical protein AFLA_005858 [Aspergillus flavus NRRL3357]|nr:hypothetical protein AFLA_005858 [Aspergillus flavus NRRL3357]